MITYDTEVEQQALKRLEFCGKVEAVIDDFNSDLAEKKLDERDNEDVLTFSNGSSLVEPTLETIMQMRGELLAKTCTIEYFIHSLKYLKLEFSELRLIQTTVQTGNMDTMESLKLKLENKKTTDEPEIPVDPELVRAMFLVDNYNMLTCLPLKTGTTNWQKTLTSLLYVNKTGRYLSPENVTSKVSNLVPRYYSLFNDDYFNPGRQIQNKSVSRCIKKGNFT